VCKSTVRPDRLALTGALMPIGWTVNDGFDLKLD